MGRLGSQQVEIADLWSAMKVYSLSVVDDWLLKEDESHLLHMLYKSVAVSPETETDWLKILAGL